MTTHRMVGAVRAALTTLITLACATVLIPTSVRATCPPDPAHCCQTPYESNCSWGTYNDISKKVLVSTRNGFLHGGFKVTVKTQQNNPISGAEIWLYSEAESGFYREQYSGVGTVCADDEYPECDELYSPYSYLESETNGQGEVLFSQNFGGNGYVDIFVSRLDCSCNPTHIDPFGANGIPYRSTDILGDGTWDDCDRRLFYPCLGQTGDCIQMADFDLDNDVDASDAMIFEKDVTGDPDTDFTTCDAPSTECPSAGSAPSAVNDLYTDTSGATSVYLTWTRPNSSCKFYDVRYSTSQITSGNFKYASAFPTAAITGAAQEATVTGLATCTSYYFAVKAIDAEGDVGAISNVLEASTSCLSPSPVVDLPETPKTPSSLDLALMSGTPARDVARIRYGIPVLASGDAVVLGIYDPAGRQVRRIEVASATPGYHEAIWDLTSGEGSRVAPGVYFVRIAMPGAGLSRSLVLTVR